MHQATDKYRGAKILTFKQLKHEFDVASLLFSGRETDSNWESRQSFFEKVKGFLPSDDAKTHKKELVQKIHEVIPGVYNTIKSIRTTLIEEALSLVEAIGTYAGDSINMHTNEAILRFLMNESSVTKKATASRAFDATNNYLTKIRFRPKVLTFLCARAQDKNPQLREFAFGYIKTVLSVHGSAITSRLTENADLTQAVADSLKKGLVDAAPTVRSACKETYYTYEEHWPTAAFEFASKLDVVTQRRLGVNTKQSSSTASKPLKPLLRRTSKSTPNAIKKPVSSVSINKAAITSRLTENARLTQAVTDSLKKSVVDVAPTVRSAYKETYYTYEENQPTAAHEFASKLDVATQRRSGVNSKQLSSTTSKPLKPLLRRTSKSAPNAIKKPVSNVGTNKAAKSNIKAVLQNSSNAAFSIASKPHTYGFSLTNQRRTMAMPAQAPSPPTMSHTESDTALNDTSSINSDIALNNTPSINSDNGLDTTSSTEPDAVLNNIPSTESDAALNNTPSMELDTVVSTAASINSDKMMSITPNTTSILVPSAKTAKIPSHRGSRVMPTPTSSSSSEILRTKKMIKKSTRPKLKKTGDLSKKYGHIKSRYRNIPK
ncbi:unnamed protein product [Mucor fragilis]